MPNWCMNELVVTGLEEHREILRGLIVNNNHVDFEKLLPMPDILKEFIVDNTVENFTLNKAQPNRLGLLKPSEFIVQVAKKHKAQLNNVEATTERRCYDIEDHDFTMTELCKVAFPDTRSIEDSVEAFAKQLGEGGEYAELTSQDPVVSLNRKLIHAMTNEFNEYKSNINDTDGKRITHVSQNKWCRENWGVKWNANDDCDSTDNNKDYFFFTAWCAPSVWIEALTKKAEELKLEISIKMQYAEQGMWFGGIYKWSHDSTHLTDTPMTHEEISDFLDVEYEEDDENSLE